MRAPSAHTRRLWARIFILALVPFLISPKGGSYKPSGGSYKPSGGGYRTSHLESSFVHEFGPGKFVANEAGKTEFRREEPPKGSPLNQAESYDPRDAHATPRKTGVVDHQYVESLQRLGLLSTNELETYHQQLISAEFSKDVPVKGAFTLSWLDSLLTQTPTGMHFKRPSTKSSNTTINDVPQLTSADLQALVEKPFSTKTVVLLPEVSEDGYQRVFGAGIERKITVSSNDLANLGSAVRSFSDLAHTEVISKPDFNADQLIKQFGDTSLVVLVGHTVRKKDNAAEQDFVLPSGKTISVQEIHAAGLRAGVLTMVMSCHSPDISHDHKLTFSDTVWMCRALQRMHDIRGCKLAEGFGRSLRVAHKSLALRRAGNTSIRVVAIGAAGKILYLLLTGMGGSPITIEGGDDDETDQKATPK